MRTVWLGLCFWVVVGGAAPLGNPQAPKGGTFTVGLPSYPKSLLYYLAYEETAIAINSLVLESLIEMHPQTNAPIPLLAARWSVSKDKKVFTFELNPLAKFSDGKPVTPEDVKFTWDTLFNPKHKTAPFQSYFSSFESCTVKGPLTVEFRAKTLHFKNLQKFSSLLVLPRHYFSEGDFNKAFQNRILGSGPYVLDEVRSGERIALRRNPAYWGAQLEQNLGRYNFDKVVFRALPDHNVAFELFKKGELDYYYFLISKIWMTETDTPPFQKGYVLKIKAENKLAYATQGIVWNLRRPLFQDRRVRWALSHLLDREKLIRELFYGNYIPATGPIHTTSTYHSPKVKFVPYDPKQARRLLTEAGWRPGPDGMLVNKDGKRFEFELITDNPVYLKWLTVYQDELKRMGIQMNIRTTDWATRIKLIDDRQFDAADVARSRDVVPSDFAMMWGSKEADLKGSSNITGYKNPEVDKLAAEIDQTFDEKKRIKLVHRIHEIIVADQPMAFLHEPTYFRLGHWNRFSFPGKGYFAYSAWRDTFHYWWWDAEKNEKLTKAMASGNAMN